MEPESHAVLEAHGAEHFPTVHSRRHAERLGMWLFLSTEVLLFAGLFLAYASYRLIYPEAFQQGSHHLDVRLGTLNTVLLITSSFTVALSVHFARHDRSRHAAAALLASFAMGLGFLAVKAVEYTTHFHEGALPGRHYTFAEVQGPGASMFYTLYFFMTGLHGIHVIIGMSVLAWVALRAWRGEFSRAYYTPVELGGLYWHLVDLVWIYIYPLLYLI